MLNEVIAALREVIAPAIDAPYPKSQAYMAAVILEIVAKGTEDKNDRAAAKTQAIEALLTDLRARGGAVAELAGAGGGGDEDRLANLVADLHAARERLGEAEFAAVRARLRQALREVLDRDLAVAGKE